MSIDFLVGAVRASNDLHPLVKTEIEEILFMAEPDEISKTTLHDGILGRCLEYDACGCGHILYPIKNYCPNCGKPVNNV